jgi:hypothetical protein
LHLGAMSLSGCIAGSAYVATLRFGGTEQTTDEFGLPVRSGLLENVLEMGFGRCIRNTAPPRGRLASITS